jgi:choline dehydrogenase-like flavoprotein
MISAGESLTDGGTTHADVIVVGAGAAGIALATRLADRAGKIILVDAGSERFRQSDSDTFFRAEQVHDSRHAPGELYRRRVLGGTTTVWGGRCIPFDPEDFQPNESRAGWPISYEAFSRYIGDALTFFDAGNNIFSGSATLPGGQTFRASGSEDLNLDRIERYSKPTNVWTKFRPSLARSEAVRVIQGAACTSVLTTADGTQVTGVSIRTASGTRHGLLANKVVLACGGMETPRILLASTAVNRVGVGNEHDMVGRHYMAHLVSSAENAGLLRLANPSIANDFDFLKASDGTYVRRMILLSPAVRARLNLPNIVFRPSRPPMNDHTHQNAVLSLAHMVRTLAIPPEYARAMTARLSTLRDGGAWRHHLRNILAHPLDLTRFCTDWTVRRILASRKLPSIFLHQKDGLYPLEFNAEQLPNPDSRVRLGNQTDPLGMPRLIIEWRYHDHEIDAVERTFRALAAAVTKSGLGEIDLGANFSASLRSTLVPQGGHHIGLTRMGDAPQSSVVNGDCEIWRTRGLFLAGPAVLPTSGFANPTLTAVGLAFRLADHLAE